MSSTSKWIWTSEDTHSKIHKLYYAYSLEHSPPVHVLFAQLSDGSMKKFSLLKESEYFLPGDKEAFESARGKPLEIPVPVPTPPKEKEKERGGSCTIC
jgi:hypothetical protein